MGFFVLLKIIIYVTFYDVSMTMCDLSTNIFNHRYVLLINQMREMKKQITLYSCFYGLIEHYYPRVLPTNVLFFFRGGEEERAQLICEVFFKLIYLRALLNIFFVRIAFELCTHSTQYM